MRRCRSPLKLALDIVAMMPGRFVLMGAWHVRLNVAMSAQNVLLWLACAAVCLLNGCRGERWAERHNVPDFKKVQVGDKLLSNEERQRFRSALLNGGVTTDSLYRECDLTLHCVSASNRSNPEVLSVYLEERRIYFGDWLDARTAVLEDKEVECLVLRRADTDWLRGFMPVEAKP